jgi:ATP-binding cassette subfamily B protein
MNADQIIVLDGGAIIGLGTHAELIANCPTYGEIVASQMAAGVPA